MVQIRVDDRLWIQVAQPNFMKESRERCCGASAIGVRMTQTAIALPNMIDPCK